MAWGPACSLAGKVALDRGHIESLDSSRWVQLYLGSASKGKGQRVSIVPRLATTSEHKKPQVHRSPVITARYPWHQKQDLCY